MGTGDDEAERDYMLQSYSISHEVVKFLILVLRRN